MIKYAIRKSIQDIDIILSSQVGHIILTFILMNENGSKFPTSELQPENFKNQGLTLTTPTANSVWWKKQKICV